MVLRRAYDNDDAQSITTGACFIFALRAPSTAPKSLSQELSSGACCGIELAVFGITLELNSLLCLTRSRLKLVCTLLLKTKPMRYWLLRRSCSWAQAGLLRHPACRRPVLESTSSQEHDDWRLEGPIGNRTAWHTAPGHIEVLLLEFAPTNRLKERRAARNRIRVRTLIAQRLQIYFHYHH